MFQIIGILKKSEQVLQLYFQLYLRIANSLGINVIDYLRNVDFIAGTNICILNNCSIASA